MIKSIAMAALAAALAAVTPAAAADHLKIGYVNTFSGPSGILGKHYRDAFDLALEHFGGKIGGLPTEVVYGDDQLKPDIAKSVAERMIQRDQVDLLAGFNFTNTLMAAVGVAIDAKKVIISSNAGPSTLAGKECSRYFFSAGHQNDGASEAMGQYLASQNIENIMLFAPNYQAGRDVLEGVKRTYKGTVLGETYTQTIQNDYAAELSQIRATNPKAVFVFLPGANGINFMKQWSQSGLGATIPLYSVYTVDHVTLPAIGASAVGALAASEWSEDFPNEISKKFVADFRAKYGYKPSVYAAKAYDTALLIDAAVRKIGGKVEDTDAFIKALETVDFPSVRGKVRINTNHMIIQGFVLTELVKLDDGTLGFQTKAPILEAYADPYAASCSMN